MAINPATAKVTELEISLDAVPVSSAAGMIAWADVQITYMLSDLAPIVTIRVPVPWNDSETLGERKGRALRSARQLIDHACRAAGVGAPEPEMSNLIENAVDAVTPPPLAG
jgi:hypothetical protein